MYSSGLQMAAQSPHNAVALETWSNLSGVEVELWANCSNCDQDGPKAASVGDWMQVGRSSLMGQGHSGM